MAFDVAAAVRDRFLRYVQIDTQSSDESSTFPSTDKQYDLLRLLVDELRAIGLADVTMAHHGYVLATVPSTIPAGDPAAGRVPVVGFLAHVDTSPEVTGAGVKPQVWTDYRGGNLVLPSDRSQVVSPEENPELAERTSHDVITSDGTTLLGADDKAGVAEIVTAAEYLFRHPELRHGPIRIALTPDEETGRGMEHFDPKAFGAAYAYTVDGGTAGEIEDETFCADTATIVIHGRNVHPGYAKDKLVNSVKLAAELIDRLPKDRLSPETTEGHEGYVHPQQIEGSVEETQIRFLIRDFEVEGLKAKEQMLREIAEEVEHLDHRASIELRVKESYRNMKYVLNEHPQVVAYAEEAIRRAGLTPLRSSIRGGTDGARLTYMGIPTPNLFAGGHNFHSKREWVTVQDMAKAVETIVQLVQVWAERSAG